MRNHRSGLHRNGITSNVMTDHMIRDAARQSLAEGEIIEISEEDWQGLASQLQVLETHDTGISGQLLLTRGPTGLIAVEQCGCKIDYHG